MDKIRLEGMQFSATHGATAEERQRVQPFLVDLEVELDLRGPATSDRLEETVSYTHLYRTVQEVLEGPPRNLLESLAGAIAQRVLEAFPVYSVRVSVKKTRPPIEGATLAGAAVELYHTRGMALSLRAEPQSKRLPKGGQDTSTAT
ncbi:MAG: dihydroneopterin aldolase [Dehalococcoidia bacterium]